MKQALLFILGLLVGACAQAAPVPVSTPTQSTSASDLESKTVALVHPLPFGEARAYCSGVWVSHDRILTAAHCVEGDELGTIEPYVIHDDVYAPGDTTRHLEIGWRVALRADVDEDHDLALIVATDDPMPEHGIAHTAQEPISQGERIFAMGMPLGMWWSFSSGEVGRVFREEESGVLYVQTTVPIGPGSSGGGLFDDRGHLLGIAKAVHSRAPWMGFFTHRSAVDTFLRGKL